MIKMIRGIREGRIKINKDNEPEGKDRFYLLWDDSDNVPGLDSDHLISNRRKRHIPAPKLDLPGHSMGYHPPKEYLFDNEEQKKYENLADEDKEKIFKPEDYEKM